MSDTLQYLIKDWLDSYEAIETLSVNNVVDNDDYDRLRNNLFENIIDACKKEVNE